MFCYRLRRRAVVFLFKIKCISRKLFEVGSALEKRLNNLILLGIQAELLATLDFDVVRSTKGAKKVFF